MPSVFGAFRRGGSISSNSRSDVQASQKHLEQGLQPAAATPADTLDAGASPAGNSVASGWGTRGSASYTKVEKGTDAFTEKAQQTKAATAAFSEKAQQALAAASAGREEEAAAADTMAGSTNGNSLQTQSAAAPAQTSADMKQEWSEEERVDYIQRLGLIDESGPEGDLLLEFLDDALANTPLPTPWTTNRDKRGRLYYINSLTRETSWNHPCDSMLQELASVCTHCCSLSSAAECNGYVRSMHSAWMQEAEDTMGKWFAADAGSGQSYYYHCETNETMWENPADVVLPAYRTKIKALAKLTDREWTQKFEAMRKAQESQPQVQESPPPVTAPAAPTSMADRTRAAEQAEAANASAKKARAADQDQGKTSIPFIYSSELDNAKAESHPHVVGSAAANTSPTGSSASSVSLSGRGVSTVQPRELKKGSHSQSEKARAAVPLLDLAATAARENSSLQHASDAKGGQKESQTKGKATISAQDVIKRAKAEHEATEEALAQERERHKEALQQQEAWQAEKFAILTEVRQALQEQEAHSLEARRREERELEARRARSARRREDWLVEQENLRAEMRQMLEIQREQAAKIERQEAQREQEHGKLEQQLRDAIEKQQRQSSEDAQVRAEREAQNQKLLEEANALRESQHAEMSKVHRQGDAAQSEGQATMKFLGASDQANNALDGSHSDWSFDHPRNSPTQTLENPASPKAETVSSSTLAVPAKTFGIARPETPPGSPMQDQQNVPLQAIQGQIAEITEQLAAQKMAQQTTLEHNAAQQELAHELHTAIKSHTDVLQEVHEVLAEARALGAHEEATESAARQDALNEQLLDEIHQSLESQKAVLRESQAQSEINIQRQIEEALAARATAESEASATPSAFEDIRSALHEKQGDIVEAKEAVTATLRTSVGEALAPLTQHIKDIECRQEELSELLMQKKKNKSEDDEFSKSAAAVDAMARQEAVQERLVQEVHEGLELQKAALREARNKAEPAIRSEVALALARNDAALSASRDNFEFEIQQALEEKQREVVETSKATAAALQKQVAEALAPLTRHVQDVERRQDDDVLRVQADEERFRAQLAVEFRKARDAQDRSIHMQLRMESAVQAQMSQALDVFKTQVKDLDRARSDDVDRMRQAELTRKLVNEEREAQKRDEQAARLQLQEAEIQQRERRRESDRLAEELHQARESELQSREADLRAELEWKVEKRNMQFRDEHRDMMFKSEVRQLEWQVDWQAVHLLEESDLLRPSSAQSSRRTRSHSRVRENLFNALAASRENLAFAGHDLRSSDADDLGDDADPFPESGHLSQPLRVRSAKQAHSQRSSRPSSSNSRRSRRPASAAHSDRSLAAEVAADLAGDPALSRASSSGRRRRSHHSQEAAGATLQKQHSSRWYDLQQARQSDQQLLKSGSRSGTNGQVALTLDEICRAYPEVSQILSLG